MKFSQIRVVIVEGTTTTIPRCLGCPPLGASTRSSGAMDFSPPSSDDELPFGSSSPAAAVSSIAAGGQRKRPRPAPAAASARGSNDDEVVVLDSSSSDSDDFVNGGAAAASKRKRAPAASSSYTSKGYSDSDSSDDDDLLAGGPTFASRPGSGNGSGSGAASASGQNNDATEKLKRTLSRLESLSSAASSAGIASTSATGNKPRKRTAEERAAEAAARKRQKAREVEARKRAREAERAAKARQKEEAKVTKTRQVLEDKQASGKFAAEEICALVDASLARAGGDDDSDAAAFAAAAASASAGEDGAPLPTGVGPLALAALEAKNYRAVIEGQTTRSDSNGMDSAAPVRWDGLPLGRGAGCVRWIRRDHLAGGSAGIASAPSNDDNVQRTDMVAIVFYNPRTFLRLLERDAAAEARDDYPELRVWLRNVRSSLATRWETRWKSDPETGGGRKGHGNKSAVAGAASSVGNDSSRSTTRIVLVLHKVQEELQRQWNQGGRRRRSFAPTSEEELNDATVWLLIEQHVECTLTSTDEETAEYLANLTRALAEAPYYDDVTELHCVAKLKADSSATTAEEKAKCAWMRQVRQLPGLSEAKARKLLEHYPTLMSLLDEYEDPALTNDEKKCLLEDCMVEGRKAKKLSESMYRLMTSNDPNELIA